MGNEAMGNEAVETKQESVLILSIPDVAGLLGMTESAVRIAISDGRLPARKWGFKTVVLRDELYTYLAGLPHVEPAPNRDGVEGGMAHAKMVGERERAKRNEAPR